MLLTSNSAIEVYTLLVLEAGNFALQGPELAYSASASAYLLYGHMAAAAEADAVRGRGEREREMRQKQSNHARSSIPEK